MATVHVWAVEPHQPQLATAQAVAQAAGTLATGRGVVVEQAVSAPGWAPAPWAVHGCHAGLRTAMRPEVAGAAPPVHIAARPGQTARPWVAANAVGACLVLVGPLVHVRVGRTWVAPVAAALAAWGAAHGAAPGEAGMLASAAFADILVVLDGAWWCAVDPTHPSTPPTVVDRCVVARLGRDLTLVHSIDRWLEARLGVGSPAPDAGEIAAEGTASRRPWPHVRLDASPSVAHRRLSLGHRRRGGDGLRPGPLGRRLADWPREPE